MVNKEFFFDLEETMITSWTDRCIINRDKIKNFIDANNIKSVNIFSFAIHDDNDRIDFIDNIQPELEDVFDIKIVNVPTVEDIQKIILLKTGNNFDKFELLSIWGKLKTFHDFIPFMFKRDIEAILIDDVVPNSVLVFKDKNIKIETINILSLD